MLLRSGVCAFAAVMGVSLAGCIDFSSLLSEPAAVSDGQKTMIVASPLPDSQFRSGERIPFKIEIYDGDKLSRRAHPGDGGHFHVHLESMETIKYVSDIPSFTLELPRDIPAGPHTFRVEYHDGDGETGRFFVTIPFRVNPREIGF